MLEWAEKLTLTPSAMTQDDVQKLRDVGWMDRDILDIAHVSAYFNYRVRMVDGLGLLVSDFAANHARLKPGNVRECWARSAARSCLKTSGVLCSRRRGRSRWRAGG